MMNLRRSIRPQFLRLNMIDVACRCDVVWPWSRCTWDTTLCGRLKFLKRWIIIIDILLPTQTKVSLSCDVQILRRLNGSCSLKLSSHVFLHVLVDWRASAEICIRRSTQWHWGLLNWERLLLSWWRRHLLCCHPILDQLVEFCYVRIVLIENLTRIHVIDLKPA